MRQVSSLFWLTGKILSKMNLVISRPVFIIGTGRCGSTLLLSILNTHKEFVCYPTEANELWHPNSFPISKTRLNTPPILQDPEQYTKMSLENWPTNQRETIKNMFTGYLYLRDFSGTLIVKSAMISFMIPTILDIFPEARFIHLYRNGVSVTSSLVKKEWFKHASLLKNEEEFSKYCAHYWKDCILEINRMNNKYSLTKKNIMYEVSYEQLCSNPRECLETLASFLGCESTEFKFDFSQIKSANYKVGKYTDRKWLEISDIMHPAMKLKGYL